MSNGNTTVRCPVLLLVSHQVLISCQHYQRPISGLDRHQIPISTGESSLGCASLISVRLFTLTSDMEMATHSPAHGQCHKDGSRERNPAKLPARVEHMTSSSSPLAPASFWAEVVSDALRSPWVSSDACWLLRYPHPPTPTLFILY